MIEKTEYNIDVLRKLHVSMFNPKASNTFYIRPRYSKMREVTWQ
jgi:hypothetical protein